MPSIPLNKYEPGHTWYTCLNTLRMMSHQISLFFRGQERSRSGSPPSVPEKKRPATASPARKVNMRSELIDQLQKWHNLREIGAISLKQYEELQQTILTDIKAL